MKIGDIPLVATIKEKCRMCYTCIRECPAKAIRVSEGQASVIATRCIGCGNCISVCSQQAKRVYCSIPEVEAMLAAGRPVAALLAPSYPAEFVDMDTDSLAGTLRWLGFSSVHEVSFGADLVAREYARLLAESERPYIATTCPAVVSYIEKYLPDMIPALAPIVSPMVAAARVVRQACGPDTAMVFIGPCIAKKGEAVAKEVAGEVDAVLTFQELRQMIAARGWDPARIQPAPLDPPRGGLGGLFPISRGLLQAAGLQEDLLKGDLIVVDGRANFWAAIRQFRKDPGDVRLLEVLSCHGCVMGPGFSRHDPALEKRHRVKQSLKKELGKIDGERYKQDVERYCRLPLGRGFSSFDQRVDRPSDEELTRILARMGKTAAEDELNCGACGYNTCRRHATAIYRGLAEVEMCLPYTIEQLRTTVQELEMSHQDLVEVREALGQSEKLASMGQVAAGIAHEVNNPLGVVLIYANLLLERCQDKSEVREDMSVIVEHADRCKKIVSGLLNFARQNKVFRQRTDIRELIEEAVRSAPPPAGVRLKVAVDTAHAMAELDPDQMHQVFTNLVSNAYAAMPGGGELSVRAFGTNGELVVEVSDTGTGISKSNLKKVFEPFFTTKQVGKGTGLGLAVAHGIIKMHSGQIRVASNADPAAGPTGTTFTITLPRHEA
ncbi:MAG: [Fe-Fe] hydrogenase large subunit C-terminal domain-containing protein [Elusimicrobiota bacterium]|jgi:signal transduction histidine kinase/Fe-S-cluster-containing hydrogenase component 2